MPLIVDLSMPVITGMVVFPRVTPPVIVEIESHKVFAERLGITREKYDVDEITNHCVLMMGDHVGTHIDSLWHVNPKSEIKADKIPLEYCYGDGVVLDFSHKKSGEEITAEDMEKAVQKIGYKIKPRDIVLIRTDCATRYYNRPEYLDNHPGLVRESVMWLLDHGIKVFGIDAPTIDLPFKVMLQSGRLWPAHLVMRERECYHLENLFNLDKLQKPYGFKFSCLPIKLVGASASPVRAVAIYE